MSRVTQKTRRRLTRSFFSQTKRLCRPYPQSAATHRFRSRALRRNLQHLRRRSRLRRATAAKAAVSSSPAEAVAKEGPPPGISLDSHLNRPLQLKERRSPVRRPVLTLNLAATPPPAPAGRTMSLKEVADALENHPDARPAHKLLALEVRARQDPALTDQYVRRCSGALRKRGAFGTNLSGRRRISG